MTDLTTITKILKKAGFVLVVLLIITLLVGLIIFRLARKPQPPTSPLSQPVINQSPAQKQPDIFDFGQAKTLRFPKNLPVFVAIPYNITDAAAKTLAASLGFLGEPTIDETTIDGKEYTWDQNDLRLIISQTTLQYHNRRDLSKPLPTTGELSLEELQEKAISFAKQIAVLEKDLEIIPQKIKYLVASGNQLARNDSLVNAQMVEFSYGKKLQNLSLVGNYPTTAYLTIRVKRDGEIISLTSRFFDKFSEVGSYTLKSDKEAIKEIEAGKGKIVQTQVVDEKGQPTEGYSNPAINTEKVTIPNISLSYFLPNDIKESIQPIFVFEGEFQNRTGENGKVVIYLPAIKQPK